MRQHCGGARAMSTDADAREAFLRMAVKKIIGEDIELSTNKLTGDLGVVHSTGKKMKQRIESAKHQPVTIDGESGNVYPYPPKN